MSGNTVMRLVVLALAVLACGSFAMERVRVSDDKHGFVLETSGKPFSPWGFNYDHDEKGRLIEDYWDAEWPKVETDFRNMKKLGANVVRVHLQFGKFMTAAEQPNEKSLARLADLLKLAEETGLYLDLTGLACYHKADVPAWYETMSEAERWAAQAQFWKAVAARCAKSPAVFCYDLMNEPVSPGKSRKAGDWLTGELGGKFFVQFISLEPRDRKRAQIAQDWVHTLAAAIRKEDAQRLITVGMLPGTAQRVDAWSGFDPKLLLDDLDYISVHIYPEKEKLGESLETLAQFSAGRPIVIEEIFPMKCSIGELEKFIEQSKKYACGWVGFYWSQTPEELAQSKEIGPQITKKWLEFFRATAEKK